MSWRASDHDDGPEPLPPHELLRLRRYLVAPPRPEVRDQHLSAITAAVRSDRSAAAAAHALVRRSARVVAGVAGIIVVTSGLAGAQIIPEPARSLIPAVSDRLAPHFSSDDEPEEDRGDEAPVGEAPAETTTSAGAPADGGDKQTDPPPATKAPATTAAPSTTAAPTTSSTSSSSTSSSTSTTEPDSSTTSTTEPDPSTTTTSTTAPGTSTTTTTAVATSSGPPPWAHGRAGQDGGGS